jgi:ABC-type enterobactin transport system permease subunit
VAWGVIYQFELGVWAIMVFALIGPMMTASVLFWLARREQEAFELALATHPDFAMAIASDGK